MKRSDNVHMSVAHDSAISMRFDALVTNAGRLRILTALATVQRQEFVHLRRATQLTDGNLASHARRLQSAGLVSIDKEFRAGKPVTHLALTRAGREALEMHVRQVMAALSPDVATREISAQSAENSDEEWVD